MRVRIIEPTKALTPERKRTCAYARVSTLHEAQDESLENEITYYKELIQSNPDYIYVDIFADYGVTGTKDDRPEFQRMLNLARQQKIDLILTKAISSFARNTTVVLEIVRELKVLGVEVIFEKDNISTLKGDGELMLTVLSAFAQEESKSSSENLKWRIKRKFEQGEVIINATRFLGYDKDEYGDLVINQGQAEIIQRIFNDYIAGKGSFIIAKELNTEGVLTIGGGRWYSSTILNILKNEKYKGDALLQKTYTKDHISKKKCMNRGEVDSFYIKDNHSPIVTKATWDKVQQLIVLRAESKGNVAEIKKAYQNRYPLTGMLFCSKCKATLRRRTWNSKYAYKNIVWQCSTYIQNGKKA